MRSRASAALGVLAWAIPGSAAACAACLSSAFGDRSYTWAYLGLILLPLVVSGVILGVIMWYAGWRPRDLVTRAWAALRGAAPGDPSPRTHTETT